MTWEKGRACSKAWTSSWINDKAIIIILFRALNTYLVSINISYVLTACVLAAITHQTHTWYVGEKEKNENETFKKAVMWMFNQG